MVLVGVFKMKGPWVQSVKKIDTVVSDDVLFALEDDLSSRVLLNEPPGYSPSIQQQQQTNSKNKKRGKHTRANQRQYINEGVWYNNSCFPLHLPDLEEGDYVLSELV